MTGGNGVAAIQARISTITSPKLMLRQLGKLSGMQGHNISLARQELTKLTFVSDQAKPAFDLLKANYLTDGVLIKIVNPSFNIRIRQSNLNLLAEGYALSKLEEAKDILGVMKEVDSPVKDMAAQAYAKLFETPQAEPVQPEPNQELDDQQNALIGVVNNISDSLDGLIAQASDIRKIFAEVDVFGKQGQDSIEAKRGKIAEDIEELEAQKDISSVRTFIYRLESDNRILEVDAVELKADTDTVANMALRMEELLDHLTASLGTIKDNISGDKELKLDILSEADIDGIVGDDVRAISQPVENTLISATATAEMLPQIASLWAQFRATGKDLMKGINNASAIAEKHETEHSAEVKAMIAQRNLYIQQIRDNRARFVHALDGSISKVAEIKTALEAEAEGDPFVASFRTIGMRVDQASFEEIPDVLKEIIQFVRTKWSAEYVPIAEALERVLELKESGNIKDKGDYASQVRIEIADILGQLATGDKPIIALEQAENAVAILTENLKLVDEKAVDWLQVAKLISNGATTVAHDEQVAEMEKVQAYMKVVAEQIKAQLPEVAKQISYTLQAVRTPANIGALKSALRKRIIGALEKIVVSNPEAEAVLVVLNQNAIGSRASMSPPPPPPNQTLDITSSESLRDAILGFEENPAAIQAALIPHVRLAIETNEVFNIFNPDQKKILTDALEGAENTKYAVYDALHLALVEMTKSLDVSDAVVNFSIQFLEGDTF